MAGVCDNQDKCDLELASARNSWRVRVKRLLEDAQKPTMQHVQRHMKEVCLLLFNSFISGLTSQCYDLVFE